MAACNVLPPVPAVFGDGLARGVAAPHRRNGAVASPLARGAARRAVLAPRLAASTATTASRCPTMIVAGWADGYTNIALRAYEAMSCPRRVIVGPWSHSSTATSIPGPHIDLVPELIRWFSRWLRDERNGIDEEPPIAVFMRRSTRPEPELPEMRGEWRSEPTWPAERLRPRTWRPEGDGADRVVVRGDVGTAAWISCAGKPPWTLPDDQREDDERSLAYDWPALDDEPRDPRAPPASDHRDVAASGRVPLGPPLRRIPRRRLGARQPRCPQPDAPRRAHGAGAARARRADGGRARARGDVVDLRGRSSRAARARRIGLAEHLAAAARRVARGRARERRARATGARRPARRSSAQLRAAAAGAGPTTPRPRRRAAARPRDRARPGRPPDASRHELRLALRRPVRREDRGALRRPRRRRGDASGPRLGERTHALRDRVA